MSVRSRYLRALDSVGIADVGIVGRRAAMLGELGARGADVPEGRILTPGAFSDDRGHGLGADARAELREALADLGDSAVRVRPSPIAPVVDDAPPEGLGPVASGQPVLGIDAVLAAIGQCRSGGNAGPTAILITRSEPVERAGVAFGAEDGEQVVLELASSGAVGRPRPLEHPRQWLVTGLMALPRTVDRGGLGTAHVVRVGALAELLRAVAGPAEGVEWALVADRVTAVGVRPVVELAEAPSDPVPVEFEPASARWRSARLWPRPVTPLQQDLQLPVLDECARTVVGDDVVGGFELRTVDGRVQTRLARVPQDRRLTRIRSRDGVEEHTAMIRRWYAEWEPELLERITLLDGSAACQAGDVELTRHLSRVLAVAELAQFLHSVVGVAARAHETRLGVLGDRLLGWAPRRLVRLLSGLPGRIHEPVAELDVLARTVRDRPALGALLRDDDAPSARLRELDPDFAGAFAGYLRIFGRRTLGMDLSRPTMAEQPDLMLRMVRDQLTSGFDPVREAGDRESEREMLTEQAMSAIPGAGDRKRFATVLARAQRSYPARDGSAFCAHTAWGLLRGAVLAIGDRLVARGVLSVASQVFQLNGAQVRSALSGRISDLHPQLPVEPAAAGRSSGPRRVGLIGCDGRGGAVGRYTGPVRVVTDEAGLAGLRPGEVLVCTGALPQWSVWFARLGAVVTDAGGLCAPAAAMAREFGRPAVVGTASATRTLHDGEVVTVDGTTGRVRPAAG